MIVLLCVIASVVTAIGTFGVLTLCAEFDLPMSLSIFLIGLVMVGGVVFASVLIGTQFPTPIVETLEQRGYSDVKLRSGGEVSYHDGTKYCEGEAKTVNKTEFVWVKAPVCWEKETLR